MFFKFTANIDVFNNKHPLYFKTHKDYLYMKINNLQRITWTVYTLSI